MNRYFSILKSLTVLLFLMFNYLHNFSQNEYIPKRSLFLKDTMLAEKYRVIADSLYNNNINDSSVYFFNKCNDLYLSIIDSLNRINPSNKDQFIIDQKQLVEKQILCIDGIIFILIYQNELDSAFNIIKQGLNYGLKYIDSSNVKIVLLINELGNYYQSKGDYEKSIENFEYSLKLLFKNQKYNIQNASNIYNNLELALLYKGEYDKGIEYFKKDLALKQTNTTVNNIELGITYGNIALAYWYKGDLDLALDFNYQQINLFLNNLGPEHHWFSIIYNNLGNIYSDKQEWAKSMEYHKKSLFIKLKNLNYYHPDVAVSYSGIASVFGEQEMYDSALVYYFKDLEISKKAYDKTHYYLAFSYMNAAKCLLETGQEIKAKQYLDTSYSIINTANNKYNSNNSIVYNNYADFYLNRINFIINLNETNEKNIKSLISNADTALGYYQLALESSVNGFSCLTHKGNNSEISRNSIMLYNKNIDLYINPEFNHNTSTLIEGVTDLNTLKNILELKGELYMKKWNFSNQ